jgi:hypothetical protein
VHALHLTWIVGLIVLWRRVRAHRRDPELAETIAYLDVLGRLERRGHPREPYESATAFARRLGTEGAPQASALARFADLYERMRFGPARSRRDLARLRRLAKAVRENTRR